jgi:hypothetical protein
MAKPKILIQLDTDPQASVFDAIVAVDAGVDQLLRHSGVTPVGVRDLVFGAMFTRGPDELHQTAIFIGGSSVDAGDKLLNEVKHCFFGPMRVSVMLDSNGANTTAAAAVLAAGEHVDLKGATVAVLAATGSVGQRIVRLLAGIGAHVRVASRALERAEDVCADIATDMEGAHLKPFSSVSPGGIGQVLDGAQVVISAGAPGVPTLAAADRQKCKSLQVVIDLSAVPPLGIEGLEVSDKATERDGAICYGAIGVGGSKMKIHKAAIARLFESNDQVLDSAEIFQLGRAL